MGKSLTSGNLFLSESATIGDNVQLGAGTKVWGLANVASGVSIGENCVIGRAVEIGPGVKMGSNCKIQNGAQINSPAVLDDGVFVGPHVVLTNDLHPRAIQPDGSRKAGDDWSPVAVVLDYGCSIGAGAICVAPVRIGKWAMVGAGSVVTADVSDYSLVRGVPARRVGWVGRAGVPLEKQGTLLKCPVTLEHYVEEDGSLKLLESRTA